MMDENLTHTRFSPLNFSNWSLYAPYDNHCDGPDNSASCNLAHHKPYQFKTINARDVFAHSQAFSLSEHRLGWLADWRSEEKEEEEEEEEEKPNYKSLLGQIHFINIFGWTFKMRDIRFECARCGKRAAHSFAFVSIARERHSIFNHAHVNCQIAHIICVN